MKADEAKIKYLEMLQTVISRMAGNCFAIKNWFIVSFGGLLTIHLSRGSLSVMLVGVLIALTFGLWDAYYLTLERKYRDKYKLALEDKTTLFDMTFDDLPAHKHRRPVLFSVSLIPYWVAVVIAIILLNHQNIRQFFNCVAQCFYGGQI